MKRGRTSSVALPRGAETMRHRRYVALHAVTATAFIFLLQRCAVNTSGLAYTQSNR